MRDDDFSTHRGSSSSLLVAYSRMMSFISSGSEENHVNVDGRAEVDMVAVWLRDTVSVPEWCGLR